MDKSCKLAVTLKFVSMQTRIWKVWERETCLPTYEFEYGTVLSIFYWLLFLKDY